MSTSPNKMTSYNLQFSEEQQEWHHNYGQQPDSNGYVTVGENLGHYHSHIFNEAGISERTARLTANEARMIANEIICVAQITVLMEFIATHNLTGQCSRYMEQRGFMFMALSSPQP